MSWYIVHTPYRWPHLPSIGDINAIMRRLWAPNEISSVQHRRPILPFCVVWQNWKQLLRFPVLPHVSHEAVDLVLLLLCEPEDRLASAQLFGQVQ